MPHKLVGRLILLIYALLLCAAGTSYAAPFSSTAGGTNVITARKLGSNGALRPRGSIKIAYGKRITFTATPQGKFKAAFLVNGKLKKSSGEAGEMLRYTLGPVRADTTIEAIFIKEKKSFLQCGNEVVEPGEICDQAIAPGRKGACPQICQARTACESVALANGGTCRAACSYAPVSQCKNLDGCCPSGCNASNDNDCPADCGNGIKDSGELCDPEILPGQDGACPSSCQAQDSCHPAALEGEGTCQAHCAENAITQCISGDGCCAPGCSSLDDSDCPVACGNSLLETGEACDTGIADGDGSCPQSCTAQDSCHAATLVDADSCQAHCSISAITQCLSGDGCCASSCNSLNDSDCPVSCGNSLVEAGENCDTAIASGAGSCPQSCTAQDSCHPAELSAGGSCQAHCAVSAITQCVSNDGCCASGCNSLSDNDCPAVCGNGLVEAGEICDTSIVSGEGSCPQSCTAQDTCHPSVLTGGGTCTASCSDSVISSCVDSDSCCASGCMHSQDNDCPRVVENVYFLLQEPLYTTYRDNSALFEQILTDVNAIAQQNTSVDYQFAGVLNYDTSPFAGGANQSTCSDPTTRPHDTYVLVEYMDRELNNSSGTGFCISLGSFQRGLKGRSIYPPGHANYSWLVQYLTHELSHVAATGNPEYYNYRYLVDYTSAVPFSERHSGPAYGGGTQELIWDDYFADYVNDPMLQKTDNMIFGPLTALLIDRDLSRQYNNREDVMTNLWSGALHNVTVRVIGQNDEPLNGVTVQGYAYRGASPDRQDAQARVEFSQVTNAQGIAVVDFMAEVPDAPKIGGWREARTIKFAKPGYLSRGIFVTVTMFEEAYFVHGKSPDILVKLLPGEHTCSDSDGGENSSVAGTMTYNVYENTDIRTLDYSNTSIVQSTFGDYCWFNYLREGRCVDGQPVVRYLTCPSGCLQFTGICVQ